MRMQKGLFVLLLILSLSDLSDLHALDSPQEVYWPYKDIEAFFQDPLNNFEKIKTLEDLEERLSSYIGWNRDRVRECFKTNFQQLDEQKMEIVMFLLSIYPHDIFADEGARIFGEYPELFVKELSNYQDWELIVMEISKRWQVFSPGLSKLSDTQFGKQVKEFALFLNRERERNLSIIAGFIRDPVGFFDEVKELEDICYWIDKYERDKNNGIYPRSVLDYLFEKHFQNLDEQKIEILIYLVLSRCDGCYGEEISWMTGKAFDLSPKLFAAVLEKMKNWKEVIDWIIELEWSSLLSAVNKIGETDFEKELKEYVLSHRW